MRVGFLEPGEQDPPRAYTEQSPPVQLSRQWHTASSLHVPWSVQLFRQRPSLTVVRLYASLYMRIGLYIAARHTP